jgi:hypothetical protein
MEKAPDQQQLWSQTTATAKNDLTIPMDVIAVQSNRMANDWLDGFTEMMFEGVTRDKRTGRIDFSKKLKARTIQVETASSENGVTSNKTLNIPLLSVALYPALTMDNVVFKLSYNVGTTDEQTEDSHNEASQDVGAQVGVGGYFGSIGFSSSVNSNTHFAATSDATRRRNTDSRATLDVTATYTRVPPAEGMERLATALLNSALPVQAG